MRVLPEVESASFDIPTETFTIVVKAGAGTAPVMTAIKDLGYTPEILDAAPARQGQVQRLRDPKSIALRDSLGRAKARGVPLVIDFGGPFCHLCRKFEDTSLKDEQVIAKLAAFEFLPVDVEADPDAATALKVSGVPDIWVLDGDGNVLARNNGYMNPAAFLAFLEAIGK